MIDLEMIKDALERHMKENGLSYRDIADAIKVSHSTLWRFTTGGRGMDIDNIARLCVYLEMPIDGFASAKKLTGSTIDAICEVIEKDPAVTHPKALCDLMRAAYKAMKGLNRRTV